MASLSNINGLFDVHSTGAILFSTSHGTSGQILRSNGNAAPTWVAASTVIGGPYLPLTGGTLTGATATDTGISFTVGGALTVSGLATFSSAVFTGGKLGVGTSDPGAEGYSFAEDLVILGGNSASDGAGITIRNNGKRYSVIAFGNGAGATGNDNDGEIYYDQTNKTMNFRTDHSPIVTFTNVGKVVAATATVAADSANTLTTKDYVDAIDHGVTQITAGTNVTITPVGGTGNVTINANTQGDITAITVGNGLAGTSLSGPIPNLTMSGSYSGTFTSTAVATDNIITSAGSLVINNPLDQNSNLIIAGRYDLGSTTLSFRSGHGGNANVWEMATIHVEDDGSYNGRIMFKTSPALYGNTPTTKMTIRSSGAIAFGTSITNYGGSGQVLTSAGNTTPTWTTPSTGTVTSVATGSGIGGGTITTTGTLTVGAGNGLSQSADGLLMSGSYTGTLTATTFSGPLSGNASTATTFNTGITNYKGVTDAAVIGQMMWKNYGNNHTIFDASQSTSPSGSSVNNTNSNTAWSSSYPTLMGWNGAGTYGVRVDSARIADSAANQGDYVTLGTAQTITASKTFSTLTYFTAGESINLKGARGSFTNEFMHLYNKVGIGNPAGWGQGETSTPNQGLSVYGGSNFAYGTSATSAFYGPITATGKILLAANNINFESGYSGNGLVLSHHGIGPSNAIVSGDSVYPDNLFINSGGAANDWSNVTIYGNVGIGTVSPDFKLQIEGGTNTEETVLKLDKGVTSDTGGHTTILAFGTESGGWAKAGIGFERTGSYDRGKIHFLQEDTVTTDTATLSDSVMTILPSGNVGIGTTSPVSKLQVGDHMATNTLTIGGWYAAGGGVLAFRSGYAPNPAYIWNTAEILATDDGNFNGRIEFKTSTIARAAPTIKMVLKANGRLGINTTTPDELVDITGGYLKFNGGDYGLKGSASLTYNPVSDHYFMANGSTKVVFKASGNVGINTTSPLNKLHVDGNVQIGGWTTAGSRYVGTARVDNGSWTNGAAGMEIQSVTESGQGNYDQKVHLISHRYNGGTSRVLTASFTTANNRVGIGDATPSYTLDVAGTIRATGDVIAYSDARVKDNVKTIDNALDKVTKLRGISYTRNDIEDKSTKIGVIAQEVLKVLPEVVSKDDEGKYSVSYGNIVGVLIEAIKELELRVKELENK
jgi:hypothetical protein